MASIVATRFALNVVLLPVLPLCQLVYVNEEQYSIGDNVESRVHADSDDESAQLARLDRISLELAANIDECGEPDYQENTAQEEVDEKWHEHKHSESNVAKLTGIADAGELVPVHKLQSQHEYGLHGRQAPRDDVVEQPQSCNGLLAPLQNGSQEPGEGEDHPPQAGGHLCIVGQHEEDDARCGTHVDVVVWEPLEHKA